MANAYPYLFRFGQIYLDETTVGNRGALVGGFVGFTLSCTFAAFLFVLIEIARNTRLSAEALKRPISTP
jgi:hypothetical protein